MPAEDFETSPRAVSVHAARYADGETTGLHAHERGQLLSASTGMMIAATEVAIWFVPTGYALWLPAGLAHDIAMRGPVAMTSAYVAAGTPRLPEACRVMVRSKLLGALIEALAEEPVLYDESGRAGQLAMLIVDEIARADASPLALPLPRDRRLAPMCRQLLAEPFDKTGLDDWALRIGMSRRSLTRHFRAETGLSFVHWRRRVRQLASLRPGQTGFSGSGRS